jgi:Fe2+ or Zn2+ uptake regulation protein
METKIKRTLAEFDINYSTYYLDETESGIFLICKDENILHRFEEFEIAEELFQKIAKKCESTIQYFNTYPTA